MCVLCLVAQLCPTVCDPMDCVAQSWLFVIPWTVVCQAPLSVGILQARILEWVAMPVSRPSSQSRDWTQVSCIAGEFFTIWATREAQQFLYIYIYFFFFFSSLFSCLPVLEVSVDILSGSEIFSFCGVQSVVSHQRHCSLVLWCFDVWFLFGSLLGFPSLLHYTSVLACCLLFPLRL